MTTEMDFIQGERFIELSDLVYIPNNEKDKTKNTFNLSHLKSGDIIYTHTKYAKRLIGILKHLTGEYLIITHNSDTNVDNSFEIPDNIIHWFSQNVNKEHSRLTSLPIGLENDYWFKGMKKGCMLETLQKNKKYNNLLYVNFSIKTNPSERELPYKLFKSQDWVTMEYGKNGKNFSSYIKNIYESMFILCPEGNGIDTVRLWETLYMGGIPIVKACINTEFYRDLPICFVKDWREITRDFLEAEYKQMVSQEWNKEKLEFKYWKNEIIRKKANRCF